MAASILAVTLQYSLVLGLAASTQARTPEGLFHIDIFHFPYFDRMRWSMNTTLNT